MHEALIEKILHLPPEKIAEVEDFVDFLSHREADRHARVVRHQAIAAYADKYAGSAADLDLELEAAAIEHLNAGDEAGQ
ncbi:MAG TPA: toxin-antitoxin system, antitoxin component, Xre family protein [Blastocatellia bacterium]|nr:toxin-antitoxin system, antitoxin component, Xre family protein [Blastocatellia bacterium]